VAGGLVALLDDVAVLARAAAASIDDVGAAAAKAGAKAAGVVIDDAAVTPQYVRGLAAQRELPIIKRIALGSLRNKFLIILPAILLLSQFVPWLLTPILMLGGAYLCYEGAEKVWARIAHHDAHAAEEAAPDEKTLIAGAVRTDLILSAEIMVITLNEVIAETFWSRLAILAVVALLMTVAVYGAVALIVKMDDAGLLLAQRSGRLAGLGRGMVKAMPRVLTVLTVVGTAAMLWVGGHILLVGADELGVHFLYDAVHHVEEAAHDATGALGGVVGWIVNTVASAILGLIIGALIVVVLTFTLHRRHKTAAPAETGAGAEAGTAGTHAATAGTEDGTVGTEDGTRKQAETAARAGATTPSGHSTQAGTSTQTGTGPLTGLSAQAGTGEQAGTGPQTGPNTQAGTGGQAGTGAQTGTGKQTGTGTQTGPNAQAGTGGQAGPGAETAVDGH
jgi:predicted DNA repair protein MutK